ncbi:hypothetical protein [Parasitella parasitica]|uniref:Phospholipid-transporting ATPase n=1 Tax=Parasitella parasitica TaxID=35722 RepID=A0A0B7NA11_9FUNG|nr:hypothetical protein [Parasitella parasitica]
MQRISRAMNWLFRRDKADLANDGNNAPNQRDHIYEEIRRKSQASFKSPSLHSSQHGDHQHDQQRRPSIQRTETTVKLRKISSKDGRRVFVNLPLPRYELTAKGKPKTAYATNKIRTSKYTVISFVPKNLFEQFRRPANMYFLAMAIIQMLPMFGVKSPALTLLPICTVVFITALKDAIEDFQRHKVDEQYNQNITHTLNGYQNVNYSEPASSTNGFFSSCFKSHRQQQQQQQPSHQPNEKNTVEHHEDTSNATETSTRSKRDVFAKSLSKDVRVGDFILLRNGDSLPADAVLLSTSDKEGLCFVETKDLDGETNLKPRSSIPQSRHIQSGADCLNECHFYLEAGSPSPDLYKFEGTLVTLEKAQGSSEKWVKKSKTPIEIDNILLRGHVVRNTKWAIAVVLFTGTDTKIMLNSGETPSKQSKVDKDMNKEIFVAFAVLFLLCLICAIMAGVMRYRTMSSDAAELFTAQTGSPGYVGFINFWSSLIIFQNIIPISLYVSIEFVKTFQAFFIWNDLDMWDEDSKKSCVPKTWTLSDDLGQVEYIFSDKTGTLTRNIMEFRECTIGGTRYGDNGFSPESEGARGARLRKEKENAHNGPSDEENCSHPTDSNTQRKGALPFTPEMVNVEEDPFNNSDEKKADESNKQKRQEIIKDYESALKEVFEPTYSSLNPDKLSFADPQIFKDIKTSDMDKDAHGDSQSTQIKEFFMLLALCHTVVIEKIGKDGKVIEDEQDEDQDEEAGKEQPKVDERSITNSKDRKQGKYQRNQDIEQVEHVDLSEPSGEALRKNENRRGFGFKVKIGGAKLLQVPGLRHLKKNRGSKRSRNSRGEEFSCLTQEKQTLDRVDDTVKTQIDYKAESPDEAALVNAAKNAGFAFIKRKGKVLTIDVLGNEYDFELLDTLDFNSDRKRMSVILRRPAPWNDIILYCKGADNVIGKRLDKDQQQGNIVDKTFDDVGAFSENGLRTLLLSFRILDEGEYNDWKKEMDEASTATENRSERIADAQEKIEVNLKLLGATGIEDKLQDGVPQCIEDLRKAGIKVWVLTGDKLETAINIGYASNLLDGDMRLWKVRGADDADKVMQSLLDTSNQLDQIEADYEKQGDFNAPMKENALVIEGSALVHIFESPEAKEQLLDIAIRCKSVVCCRVSPLQKALVVQLVRKYHNVVTLAVGDGANDVSMIQVANVGVGIAGQEGVQASMAADYAISQFRFLHKLLLVQGHWSYSRVSEMILTFFFKNVFWVFPSLWYQIYSAWSGNIFYDYSFLQLYNIIFTVAPVVIIGATDQDLTSPYLKHLPGVYTVRGKLYTKFRFWLYFFDGIWQSVVVFYAFYFLWIGGNPNPNGRSESMLQLSTSVAVTAIVLANIMPGFNTYYWTWWQFTFIGIEILITFLWVVIYGAFPSVSIYGMAKMVFGSWSFWMTFFLAIVVAFLPRYLITFICQWYFPNVVARGRHLELYEKRAKRKQEKKELVTNSSSFFGCCFGRKRIRNV